MLFDCSTRSEVLAAALPLLNPGGAIECPGGYYGAVPVDLFAIYVKDLTLHSGLANAGTFVAKAIELIRQGRISPAAVASALLDMDDAPEALADPAAKPVFRRDVVAVPLEK